MVTGIVLGSNYCRFGLLFGSIITAPALTLIFGKDEGGGGCDSDPCCLWVKL